MTSLQSKQPIRLDALARKIIQQGVLSLEDVQQIVLESKNVSESFANYIEQRNIIVSDTLLSLKSDVYGVPIVDVFNLEISDEAIELVTKSVAQEKGILPLEVVDGSLLVALSDPMDFKLLSDLRLMTKKNIEVRLAMKADIASVVASTYPSDLSVGDWLHDSNQIEETTLDGADEVSDAPVVRLVATLLSEAVDKKASDIHFDPQLKELVIRIRVDGELVTIQKFRRRCKLRSSHGLRLFPH